MKKNGTNTEAPISGETIRMAIAYLDSRTDYREFISPTECRLPATPRWDGAAPSQDESLWLLLVPVVVIVFAVIVLVVR